jgi:hypothetical protein
MRERQDDLRRRGLLDEPEAFLVPAKTIQRQYWENRLYNDDRTRDVPVYASIVSVIDVDHSSFLLPRLFSSTWN